MMPPVSLCMSLANEFRPLPENHDQGISLATLSIESLPKYIEKPLNAVTVLSNDDQFIVMYKTTCVDFYIIEKNKS